MPIYLSETSHKNKLVKTNGGGGLSQTQNLLKIISNTKKYLKKIILNEKNI